MSAHNFYAILIIAMICNLSQDAEVSMDLTITMLHDLDWQVLSCALSIGIFWLLKGLLIKNETDRRDQLLNGIWQVV